MIWNIPLNTLMLLIRQHIFQENNYTGITLSDKEFIDKMDKNKK